MDEQFASAQDAANDPRILVFGRLLGAANRLEFILGRALEESTGLSHSMLELLLVVGRAGDEGIALRDIAQARVLTSGGATRLVQRASEQGLVQRRVLPADQAKVFAEAIKTLSKRCRVASPDAAALCPIGNS